MAVVCDTGALYALDDADDAHHADVARVVAAEPGPLYVPMSILAEVDYLLTARLSVDAALDFLESLEDGAFTLEPLEPADVIRCRELMIQYRDLEIGLADASIVAVADRLGIDRILTVDLRHFRVFRPHGFPHFVLLPADQPQ